MKILYDLKNIKHYYEGKKVLDIKELILEENQIIGFLGPNGSGKSTLFSLLSFVSKASKGEITFDGLDSSLLGLDAKQDIVILPQNPYLLKRSVFQNIAYGLKIRKKFDNLEEQVNNALSLVGLDKSFSNRKHSELSGGEAQRVALAARLVLKPKVLILDEPTAGVDTNSAQLIKEAILLAKEKYKSTVLISSHDHNWLNHISDMKVALFQGKLVQSGSINLLYAPWEKNEEGNLVKVFLDGQKLTIPNSSKKKRDSVLMINSNNITINKSKEYFKKDISYLEGVVSSIRKEKNDEKFWIDFSIAGIALKLSLLKDEYLCNSIMPGSVIDIRIDAKEVYWI